MSQTRDHQQAPQFAGGARPVAPAGTAAAAEATEPSRPGAGAQVRTDPSAGEQFAIRAGKRERLRSQGWDPYPVQLPVTTTIAEVRARYGHLEAGQETHDEVG